MKSEFIKYIKSKKFLVVFIVLMILSIVQSVDTFYYTKIIPFYGNNPPFISILCNNNNIKYTSILTWLMPIYLILAFCDKYNIEKKRGLHNLYLTRITRKKHFFVKMGISFINPFIVAGIPVLFNLLVNTSFLYGGNGFEGMEHFSREDMSNYLYICLHHPYITYLLYVLSFLVICGILSCVCQSICIITRDNKISYVLCLAFWMLYFTDYRFSVAPSIQPLVYEYLFIDAVRGAVCFCVPAIIIIITAYIISMGRKDEI